FIEEMTALLANTTYYVRAYATNSAGTAYGNEISFTTLDTGSTTNQTETESNNTVVTANEFFINSQMSAGIGESGDEYDWYTFTTQYDGSITFHGIPTSTLGLGFTLYNAQGTTSFASQYGAKGEEVQYEQHLKE